MANTYFDFKQFRVEQSECANKISTDACVFGAWMARLVSGGRVLDVGTGTGLLALMLAQGSVEHIDGIEIEACCAKQAEANINASKFGDKINIVCADARAYTNETCYDFIISNPPFFNNTYQNTDNKKNQARQTETLGAKDWKLILENNGKDSSIIALLLSNNDVLKEYEQQLNAMGYLLQRIELFDHAKAVCKRVILFASRQALKIQIPSRFVYKDMEGIYSEEMKTLLANFYLSI